MMQGYNILRIQAEMQDRIDELETALAQLCASVDASKLKDPATLTEAKSVLDHKIERRGGDFPRGWRM